MITNIVKRQAMPWEERAAMYVSNEDPGFGYKNFLQVGKKTANSPMGKWVKDTSSWDAKEETVQASHHTRGCSPSREIRKQQNPLRAWPEQLLGACRGARGGSMEPLRLHPPTWPSCDQRPCFWGVHPGELLNPLRRTGVIIIVNNNEESTFHLRRAMDTSSVIHEHSGINV